MVNNDGLNPYQVHAMFGEHVSVRLETVTVTRRDGAVPPRKLPVLVLEIEQPEGPTVKVTFEAEAAAEFGGLYSEQLRQVTDAADVEYWAERGEFNPRQHHAGPEARAQTAGLLDGILAREAAASTRLDRDGTFTIDVVEPPE